MSLGASRAVGFAIFSLVGVLALLSQACDREPARSSPPMVEVGVFYGGQVQRLQQIEVSRLEPPKVGIRVHLDRLARESKSGSERLSEIVWEVVSPGPAGRRVKQRETIRVQPGKRTIDQLIPIHESSRLGVWNVRVTGGGRVLADRALFFVGS